MPPLVDTHAHLDGLAHDGTPSVLPALDRALEADVQTVLAVGGNPEGNRFALEMAAFRPTQIYTAVGYDRYMAEHDLSSLPPLEPLLSNPSIVALGEIGLDFHYAPETASLQIALFESMLALARQHRLPVLIHCREAEEAMRPILENHAAQWEGDAERLGVIHCYTGSVPFAEAAVSLGFFISYSGILTFPKAENVRASARIIPLHRLLVETDTPYLAPVPFRGKQNEPAFLPHIVRELARIRGLAYEEMAERTTLNAQQLFGLNPSTPKSPIASAPRLP